MAEDRDILLNSLLVNQGIYSKVRDATPEEFETFTSPFVLPTLDLFCPYCKQNKTFIYKDWDIVKGLGIYKVGNKSGPAMKSLTYICPTCDNGLFYLFRFDGKDIMKLAQYPSLYDVSRDELKKYKKNDWIDEESFDQIYKADICASSGYFVAAYTYMRRVYETLMLSVFKQHQANIDISENEFKKLGGHEKIAKIRAYLAIDDGIYGPLYSLLSGGVHTYTEEECSNNYAFLKCVLLDVLAEQKAKKEREANRQAILKLHSQMKAERK